LSSERPLHEVDECFDLWWHEASSTVNQVKAEPRNKEARKQMHESARVELALYEHSRKDAHPSAGYRDIPDQADVRARHRDRNIDGDALLLAS
jgi:hypothetical protein